VSLVAVVLLCALVAGAAAGGSLDRLGALPLRRRRLVVLALLTQLAGVLVGGPAHPLGLAVSAGLVVAFLAANRGIRGTGLIALGLLANALVVGANGAMPVSLEAAARAGVDIGDLVSGADPRHEPADDTTRLSWLGDVVPVPLPWRPEVVSPGDVLVAAGAGQLVVAGMLRPRRRVPPLPRWLREDGHDTGDDRQDDTADGGRDAPCDPDDRPTSTLGALMAKRARKRRARKKNGANHGKRPNA
jgi:hypothetical protein